MRACFCSAKCRAAAWQVRRGEALAKKVGTHQVYIAQLEGSANNPPTRTPSLPMLERLAKALKVKVGKLVE